MNVVQLTTLANAEQWLGFVPGQNPAIDAIITRLILAASAFIRRETGRVLASVAWTETYNGVGSNRLMLRNQPVTAIMSLQIGDTVILPAASPTATGYLFDDKMIYLNGFLFYRGFQNIQVTYQGGPLPGDDDATLAEDACIELVAWDFKRKDRIQVETETLAGQVEHYTIKEVPDEIARKIWRLKRVTPI
jgi:hypothetical protein